MESAQAEMSISPGAQLRLSLLGVGTVQYLILRYLQHPLEVLDHTLKHLPSAVGLQQEHATIPIRERHVVQNILVGWGKVQAGLPLRLCPLVVAKVPIHLSKHGPLPSP